jgi:hypothetical protein
MRGPCFNWTGEAVETLRQMWEVRGCSASEIALTLGATRSAVLGKVHRKKMVPHSRPKPMPAPVIKRTRRRKPPVVFVEPPPTETQVANMPEPVRFGDLQALHCRWPVSGAGAETLFCGAVVVGSSRHSWCPTHHQIGHAPGPPTRR